MKRLVSLDVLRAVAILLVLGRHQPKEIAPGATRAYELLALWHRVGWVGVDLFFVLSGFLIGGLLLAAYRRSGSLAAGRFYVRRAFRIWPGYAIFLLAAAALWVGDGAGSAGDRLQSAGSALWPNLLHVQNYVAIPDRHIHTWSLAVEEHFYLVLPVLLAGLAWAAGPRPRTPFAALPWVFVAAAVGCVGLRLLTAAHAGYEFRLQRQHFPSHLRIDSLLAGVALSHAVTFRAGFVAAARRVRWALPALAALCYLPAAVFELDACPFLWTAGYSLLWLGSSALLLFAWLAEDSPLMRSRAARWLAAVGVASYSIYLWHVPFGQRLALWLCHASPVPAASGALPLMAVFVVVSVALGWGMLALVERPALAVRDRLFPATVRRPALAPMPRPASAAPALPPGPAAPCLQLVER